MTLKERTVTMILEKGKWEIRVASRLGLSVG
jgi:hypothetical protein